MCYSEPLYEERKKQLNSTTNVSISEEIETFERPEDISSEIETFVVEFSCFFLSSYYIYIYIYNIYIIIGFFMINKCVFTGAI